MKGHFRLLLFISLTYLLNSCEKEHIVNDYPELSGDYEWVYTQLTYNVFITSAESEDKYGIRILNKDKVQLFKNGKRQETYKITGIYPPSFTADPHILCETKKGKTIKIGFEDDQLFMLGFPYEEEPVGNILKRNNVFKKK